MKRYMDGIAFAVLWTLVMALIERPDTAGLIILVVCGAIAGVLFHFAMRWWAKWVARSAPPA